jgi:hypothetical protein
VTAILSLNAGRSRDGWLLLLRSPELCSANWTLVLGRAWAETSIPNVSWEPAVPFMKSLGALFCDL